MAGTGEVRDDAVGAQVPAGLVDTAVAAFVDSMVRLVPALGPGARADAREGRLLYRSGLAAPRLNGALVTSERAGADDVTGWLRRLAREGVPFCLMVRPPAPAWVPDVACRLGLDTVDTEPFMVLPEASTATAATPGGSPPGTSSGGATTALRFARVDPADAELVDTVQQVSSAGFEVPREVLDPLMSAPVLALPGVSGYLGVAGGAPVVVGLGARAGEFVGVFNIGTPPEHRRRGHADAMTRHVVGSALAAGAHSAYLQASRMGYGVYARMGFVHAETWSTYVRGD